MAQDTTPIRLADTCGHLDVIEAVLGILVKQAGMEHSIEVLLPAFEDPDTTPENELLAIKNGRRSALLNIQGAR